MTAMADEQSGVIVCGGPPRAAVGSARAAVRTPGVRGVGGTYLLYGHRQPAENLVSLMASKSHTPPPTRFVV